MRWSRWRDGSEMKLLSVLRTCQGPKVSLSLERVMHDGVLPLSLHGIFSLTSPKNILLRGYILLKYIIPVFSPALPNDTKVHRSLGRKRRLLLFLNAK